MLSIRWAASTLNPGHRRRTNGRSSALLSHEFGFGKERSIPIDGADAPCTGLVVVNSLARIDPPPIAADPERNGGDDLAAVLPAVDDGMSAEAAKLGIVVDVAAARADDDRRVHLVDRLAIDDARTQLRA